MYFLLKNAPKEILLFSKISETSLFLAWEKGPSHAFEVKFNISYTQQQILCSLWYVREKNHIRKKSSWDQFDEKCKFTN